MDGKLQLEVQILEEQLQLLNLSLQTTLKNPERKKLVHNVSKNNQYQWKVHRKNYVDNTTNEGHVDGNSEVKHNKGKKRKI